MCVLFVTGLRLGRVGAPGRVKNLRRLCSLDDQLADQAAGSAGQGMVDRQEFNWQVEGQVDHSAASWRRRDCRDIKHGSR